MDHAAFKSRMDTRLQRLQRVAIVVAIAAAVAAVRWLWK
jgi:hypothetical protein